MLARIQSNHQHSELSRPTTQDSIQSSKSSLINIKLYQNSPTSIESTAEDDTENHNFNEDPGIDALDHRMIDVYQPSPDQIKNSAQTASDILTDLPSSCIAMALLQITSNLQNLNQGQVSSEFTSSSQLSAYSPVNYQDLSPTAKRSYIRQMAIEEVLETEENYVNSLHMLSEIYLESIISKGNNGIPLRLLHEYVCILIKTHQCFLFNLRKLLYSSFNDISTNENNFAYSLSSPLIAALVADLISKRAISVYLYEEYLSIHDLVLKLIDSKESDPLLGASLTNGFQSFLEASQSNGMDLSLSSLLTKPIARISKYKLFLENLLKLTPHCDDEECHNIIANSLQTVESQIQEINRYGLQEKYKATILFENLSFTSCAKKLNFPVEYLGMPILMGSLYGVWIGKERRTESRIFGAFLFKSHLILAVVPKYNKYEVKFLIPLSNSQLVRSSGARGGMFTRSENTFKIMFEHDYMLFELLLITNDDHEFKIWYDKLDILINDVNGPCKLDYVTSKLNQESSYSGNSIIIPNHIQCYEAKLEKFNTLRSGKSILSRCYFSDIIPIKISYISVNDVDNSIIEINPVEIEGEEVVTIDELEKSRIEYLLEDLWSNELLLNGSNLNKRRKSNTIRKNGSSKSLRQLHILGTSSFRSRRNRSHRSPTSDDLSINCASYGDETYADKIKNEMLGPTSHVSIMRRTSIVLGSAFKAMMTNSDHEKQPFLDKSI